VSLWLLCSRPSIVSNAEFEADKASLLRMLADFEQDHPQMAAALAKAAAGSSGGGSSGGSSSAGAAAAAGAADTPAELLNTDAVNKGMQVGGAVGVLKGCMRTVFGVDEAAY
jgi:hypothetical protein